MFLDVNTKAHAYTNGIMSKQRLLAKTVLLLLLKCDVQACPNYCMRKFGIPCQHDVIRILITDGSDARLNRADKHAHCFLDKVYVPVCDTSDARI